VDGKPGAPGCPETDAQNDHQLIRELAKVGPGEHTITATLNALNAFGQITGWETDYTIYERKVKGGN